MKDKNDTRIAAQIQIKLSLVYEPESEDNFESLMKTIGADVSRLHNAVRTHTGISTLGTVLQLTKDIMDVVGTVCHSYSFATSHRIDFVV